MFNMSGFQNVHFLQKLAFMIYLGISLCFILTSHFLLRCLYVVGTKSRPFKLTTVFLVEEFPQRIGEHITILII